MGSFSGLQGIFPTQDRTIAGRFFTTWAIREAPSSQEGDFIFLVSSLWEIGKKNSRSWWLTFESPAEGRHCSSKGKPAFPPPTWSSNRMKCRCLQRPADHQISFSGGFLPPCHKWHDQSHAVIILYQERFNFFSFLETVVWGYLKIFHEKKSIVLLIKNNAGEIDATLPV